MFFALPGKNMVVTERFDEERSDEEPCGMTARQLLHKISQPDRAKRAWEARKQKSGAAANEICSADTAVLRERFRGDVSKKGQKNGRDREIRRGAERRRAVRHDRAATASQNLSAQQGEARLGSAKAKKRGGGK